MSYFIVYLQQKNPTLPPKRVATIPYNPEYPSSVNYASDVARRLRELYALSHYGQQTYITQWG